VSSWTTGIGISPKNALRISHNSAVLSLPIDHRDATRREQAIRVADDGDRARLEIVQVVRGVLGWSQGRTFLPR